MIKGESRLKEKKKKAMEMEQQTVSTYFLITSIQSKF